MVPRIWRFHLAMAIVVVSLSLLLGCSDDPAEPDNQPFTISGTVTDADGNPVADALILLDLSYDRAEKTMTSVSFALPEPDHVRFDVVSWCRDEIFMTTELDLPAGTHSVLIESIDASAKQLTEQPLWFILTASAGVLERSLVLFRNIEGEGGDYIQWDHTYVAGHVRIQATTDADGRYEIVDPCLGFGDEVAWSGENGEVVEGSIALRVRAWAYHADHAESTPSDWVNIGQDSGCTANISWQ